MGKIFLDIESNEFVTEEQLAEEYKTLKNDGDTEAETFSDYLNNCMTTENGTLIFIEDMDAYQMENRVEKILRRDYELCDYEVDIAVTDICCRCFSVTGKPDIEDLEEYIAEYMDR